MKRTVNYLLTLLLVTGTMYAGRDSFGDTSAANFSMPLPACSTTVTNTGDSGLPGSGSLRAALICANSNPGPDSVSFNIPLSDPGFSGGVFGIRPLSGLPPLTDNGTTIDGATQTAFTGDTNAAGPEVVVNGSLAGFSVPSGGGFHIFSGANRINSLVINGFATSGTGIVISGANATGNNVTGCYIGTNSTGLAANPNSLDGIVIATSASNNVIGGNTPQERNVISGNTRFGVLMYGQGGNPSNNVIKGNFIGTDASGMAAVGNDKGVGFVIANFNTVGGTTPGAGNVISGNIGEGIHSNGSGNQTIQGNFIGTNVTGAAAVPNGFGGINIFSFGPPTTNNVIGGSSAGAGNLISGNLGGSGLSISGGANNNIIQGNRIGTDISGNSPIPNEGGGISIGTAGNLIGGTYLGARNLISGNANNGLVIFGNTATGNQIQGNLIGTNASGNAAIANSADGIGFFGAPNNTIGGTAPGAGNLISGNDGFGINIGGPTATGNQIQGNLVGTDVAGNASIPNSIGINITSGQNTVGGTSFSARNVISGNAGLGLRLRSTNATQNLVQGNYIGTDASGTIALGNIEGSGIAIGGGASRNQVGGTTAGAGNTVSGNGAHGIQFGGVGTSNNTVQGNLVGTNASGSGAIPNQADGIRFSGGASGNLVGGLVPAARNIVSSNLGHGIHIDNMPVVEGGQGLGTGHITVQGNFIGTDFTGINPLGNRLPGVIIFGGASDNLIGGSVPGAGNVVAFTTGGTIDDGNGGFITLPGTGISVANDGNVVGDAGGGTSLRNRISQNSVFSNNGLGIDLSDLGIMPDPTQGPTGNDPTDADSGANSFQNFPVLNSVALSGGSATIQGTLNSAPNATYTLEFFSNSVGEPSGHGEGQSFLGSTTVVTDGSGNANFTYNTTVTSGQIFFSATATDADGNTSEFSASRSIFEYLVGGGSFVIGDHNTAVGDRVTFWGSGWASSNQLSGGTAPSSFKGFANATSSSPFACGGTWSTSPGNSSNPPASVPAYMAVIVTSSAAKRGSTISGSIAQIAIVKTDPGYSSNPGHTGTGEIVAILCP